MEKHFNVKTVGLIFDDLTIPYRVRANGTGVKECMPV